MEMTEAVRIGLATALGLVGEGGKLRGGYFVVRREWPRKFLQYFLALGAGYMLAVALIDILPESVRLAGQDAFLWVLAGFFLIHLFEHTIAPHFHFGEETDKEEFAQRNGGRAGLLGVAVYAFFFRGAVSRSFFCFVC